jgi:hypothetical protein
MGIPAMYMKELYEKCSQFLMVQQKPNSGITVIVTPKWFFMSMLTQPYCKAPNGNPVYLDGFDFAGLISLQTTVDTWPGTAGIEDQTITVMEAYSKSTKFTSLTDESPSPSRLSVL